MKVVLRVLKAVLILLEFMLGIGLTLVVPYFALMLFHDGILFIVPILIAFIIPLLIVHAMYMAHDDDRLKARTSDKVLEVKGFWRLELIPFNLGFVFGLVFTIISPIVGVIALIAMVWNTGVSPLGAIFLYFLLSQWVVCVPLGIYLLYKSFRYLNRILTPAPFVSA